MDLNPAESFISFSSMAVLQVALGPAASLWRPLAQEPSSSRNWIGISIRSSTSQATHAAHRRLSAGKIAPENSDRDVRLQVKGRVA